MQSIKALGNDFTALLKKSKRLLSECRSLPLPPLTRDSALLFPAPFSRSSSPLLLPAPKAARDGGAGQGEGCGLRGREEVPSLDHSQGEKLNTI